VTYWFSVQCPSRVRSVVSGVRRRRQLCHESRHSLAQGERRKGPSSDITWQSALAVISSQIRIEPFDFQTATLHVRRVKQGTRATHPIVGDELRALRRLYRDQEPKSAFVFTSERGSPFSVAGFARLVERAGAVAKVGLKAHPHMPRHASGYALANKGHDTRA
jgi:hypothetical protein